MPPAVSAKKIEGQRAYRIARRGEEPDLSAVPVTIYRLEVERAGGIEADTDFSIEVECSSGTYVRSIARDLGRLVGVPAHLAALRRTGVGPWEVERAMPFDASLAEAIPAFWRPMREAVAHLPRVELHAEDAKRFAHGQKLATAAGTTPVAVFAGNELIGIADVEDGLLKPDVVLAA